MIRVVNVTDTIVARLATVSDLSYAWEIVNDYIGSFHDRVRRDPRSVVLLRATFLKLVSILDVPLTRVLGKSPKCMVWCGVVWGSCEKFGSKLMCGGMCFSFVYFFLFTVAVHLDCF